jgi:alpha-1,2-mannosyltransferase
MRSLLFLALLSALFNHIDDTDEPYGYYEPLHFILYGHGMQTWEYAPQFAIRSYAFLLPIYTALSIFKDWVPNKLYLFYLIRILLGSFAAYSLSTFINSLQTQKMFSSQLPKVTCILLVTSPGILFSSTCFLPSAVCSSFLLLCLADWMQQRCYRAIAWGSIAVLWTGWPFVGLLFLPVGIHMLFCEYQRKGKLLDVIWFCVGCLGVVVMIAIPALLVDRYYYNKW